MHNSESSKTTYSISELAQEFGISTRTIRYYEDKGLLTPQRHGQNRIYSSQERFNLKLILRSKRLGFSLQESKNMIDLYQSVADHRQPLAVLLEKIAEKRLHLQQHIRDIELMQQELDTAEQHCRSLLRNKP